MHVNGAQVPTTSITSRTWEELTSLRSPSSPRCTARSASLLGRVPRCIRPPELVLDSSPPACAELLHALEPEPVIPDLRVGPCRPDWDLSA